MEIIDYILIYIWTFCGVIGFICIFCVIGFTIIAVTDDIIYDIKYKKIKKNIKKFKEENK